MKPRILSLSSIVIRLTWLQSQLAPHVKALELSSLLAAIAYIYTLRSWLSLIFEKDHVKTVHVREVEVSPTRHKEYPVKRIKQEIEVSSPAIRRRPSILETHIIGGPSTKPNRNIFALALNTVLVLWLLDQTWSSRLFLRCHNLSYARVSDLSPTSASINVRLPSTGKHAIARIAYRPLLSAGLLSEESPVSWELSQPVRVPLEDDWTSSVTLEGLHPSLQYEYKIYSNDEATLVPPLNFTTFPDPRLSSKGSSFRFVHAGAPRYHTHRQNPFSAVPALLPLTYPFTTPTPSHIFHQWRANHLRQPAWGQLGVWLADLRERSAWTQVEFALIGSGIESIGAKYKPMSLRSSKEQRRIRQIMASEDVKNVYENIPILPAFPRSPSQGPVVEPGAVSTQSTTFEYGSAAFYRLRRPFQEMGQEDSVDWLNDMRDLKQWLSSVSSARGFKFVMSPMSLAPWLGGRKHEREWRKAVLDAIAPFSNVVVLADSKDGFVASTLRETIVEIASPPITSPPRFSIWPRKIAPPFLQKSKAESTVPGRSQGNMIIKFIPSSSGARWTSIEIDETSLVPRALVSALKDGKVVDTIEIVGVESVSNSHAVGWLSESFANLLYRLGLRGKRWV